MVISAPLSVHTSRNRKFILNLNNYMHVHHHALNAAKKNYKALLAEQILRLPKMKKAEIGYVLYPKTKRKTDIGNVIAIHKKFFEDAMVEFGIIPDDDYTHIVGSYESFGAVDKENPRVEIRVLEIE
jgi:Holliday junction resolvase RusA-like endonuclease